MASQGEACEERIYEFDDDLASEFSALLGVDALQILKRQHEEDHKERMKMKKGFNSQMRSEARLMTFVTYESFKSWTPQDMAAAGFYHTGVKLGVQCFCCSLILFSTRLKNLPIEIHKKLHPECEFLLGKDVGNIGKYNIRVKSPEKTLRSGKAQYQEEEDRLESFEKWPFYAHGTSPRVLSAAGFVFTGERDTVQCFSCSGCLGNWEEGDHPWKEHAKWFPKCEFLQSEKSSEEIAQYIQSYEGFVHVTGEHFMNSWVRRELPMVSDQLFANLNKFPGLKELSVRLDGKADVLSVLPGEFPNLHHMEKLSIQTSMESDLSRLAKGATSRGFQNLENLDISMNHKITEEGYRHFFQALNNLPNLQELNISRHIPERIQVQATTVKALSQCVMRLPRLTRLRMLSWLLDEEDMKVMNAMKERHPQCKCLIIHWKWIVPFSPVIQK
ncbi:baculoviral IAP repeat-containing protein 1b-like [Meriones unguiculatus]|uniref:baculoviral IAP repeat-containing protein 1b-like n=1 Tax=Meriones unguiculatus TaxID=10047 RepID=UPI00293E058F|nr:baculoviral IAP repeat-containing protein 1b-like [Meriones unguiculatus]